MRRGVLAPSSAAIRPPGPAGGVQPLWTRLLPAAAASQPPGGNEKSHASPWQRLQGRWGAGGRPGLDGTACRAPSIQQQPHGAPSPAPHRGPPCGMPLPPPPPASLPHAPCSGAPPRAQPPPPCVPLFPAAARPLAALSPRFSGSTLAAVAALTAWGSSRPCSRSSDSSTSSITLTAQPALPQLGRRHGPRSCRRRPAHAAVC